LTLAFAKAPTPYAAHKMRNIHLNKEDLLCKKSHAEIKPVVFSRINA
jgi:hypothetical protein